VTSKELPLEELLSGHRAGKAVRHLMRALPSNPRCKLCNAPFTGAGRVLRVTGFRQSRLNPRFCNLCFEKIPLGGAEMELGVLFADVRGFTALAESMPPREVQERLARFYSTASNVLIRHDALVDTPAGDQVLALFLPPIVDGDVFEHLVDAGLELLAAVDELPVGAGADFGTAFVGNVGSSELAKDFTALGDVVNVASRLQGAAADGELVLSEHVWEHVAGRFPDARRAELELKGKSAPVAARVLGAGSSGGVDRKRD
jgi:adenylate cyclase